MIFLNFIIYFAINIPNIIGGQDQAQNEDCNVCLTPACVTAAADIIRNMDEQINPCDDFYQFACGAFLNTTEIPDDKIIVDSLHTIQNAVNKNLRAAIEQPLHVEEPKPFKLVKQLYKQCMDTISIEENGLTYLNGFLNSLGGWPVVEGDDWVEEKFEWRKSIYKLRRLGYDTTSFITFNVEGDPKNSTKRVVTIDQASLALPQEVLIKGDANIVVKAYYDYIVEVAVILGADRVDALKELKKSWEFERELARISLSLAELFNITALNNPFTVQELNEIYPLVDWKEYINSVLNISDIQVKDDETVIVKVPKYLIDLEELLRRTPKRVQANYVIWRAIDFSVPYLTNELRNKRFQLDIALNGIKAQQSRSEECVNVVSANMALATSSIYIHNYFREEFRENVRTMVTNIRDAFKNTLKKLEWMDEITRKNSLEKLQSMVLNIGYSDDIIDNEKLEKYYSHVELNLNNFLQSILNLLVFDTNNLYKQLRQPVNRTEWDMSMPPATVNGRYLPDKNMIEIPAAILEGAFYSYERPQYMNYGGIGFAIGHEITHGFDENGKQYDKEGNLRNWWTDETNNHFLNRGKCMIHQYSNYTVSELELKVDGELTLNENIADNGGIKQAYVAYKEWVKRKGPEMPLPGLNYTTDQLFWISAANTWCTKYQTDYLKLVLLIDPHSPNEFRIRVPFSNSEYFANDFKCSLGSNMNPVNKCHIW